MPLLELRIENFKSFKYIQFLPQKLNVLVGPNGSGKSNFANAINFLAQVYEHGLEFAVSRAGGYDNIAFRKKQRTRSGVSFFIRISADSSQGPSIFDNDKKFTIYHYFNMSAEKRNFSSEYSVTSEEIIYEQITENEEKYLRLIRVGNHVSIDHKGLDEDNYWLRSVFDFIDAYNNDDLKTKDIKAANLLFQSRYIFLGIQLMHEVGSWKVYQIHPQIARKSSAPTPNVELEIEGGNLPSLVYYLIRNNKKLWNSIISSVREVVPYIEDISTYIQSDRMLALRFTEKGMGRPLTSNEVSDGTIQYLAMVVACSAPGSSLVCIEEPETSLHPWAIKSFLEVLKKLSLRKTVIITTHSPILIDDVGPENIIVVNKESGISQFRRLIEIDHNIISDVNSGTTRLSSYFDSGLIPQLVPGGME